MSDNGQEDQFIYDGHIDYDHLITASMHWLIRTTLSEVAKKGLPGEHHLYISFDTTDPDVTIPDSLRRRYPQEMTIVLQNRFYDLTVLDQQFSVSLSFSRVLERLTVPFHALTRFYDPSCGFVLQLGNWDEGAEPSGEMPEYATEQDQLQGQAGEADSTDADNPQDDDPQPTDANNVVNLDQFRKNNS